MHPRIWEASGHTSTFSDLMVDCLLTKKRFRADQSNRRRARPILHRGDRLCRQGMQGCVLRPGARGKPPESARKVALQFYHERGLAKPFDLLGERAEPLENSIRYNPENGSLLTSRVRST